MRRQRSPHCGFRWGRVHDLRRRTVRDLGVLEQCTKLVCCASSGSGLDDRRAASAGSSRCIGGVTAEPATDETDITALDGSDAAASEDPSRVKPGHTRDASEVHTALVR